MPTTFTSVLLVSAALAVQVAAPPPAPAAGTKKPAAQSTAKPGSLQLTVTSETGQGLGEARVAVHGPVDRAGSTGADGVLILMSLPAGNYRCRIIREGFITLDKEITIRASARLSTEGVLSPAPAPPPPPPPPPKVEPKPTAPPMGTPGQPRVLSIAEMADQMVRELKDTQPLIEREVGCSGVTSTKIIVTRENVALHRHAEADEVVYLLAGEATLTVAEKDQAIVPGWFGLIPRGTSHSLARRGRNPFVILSVQSGVACSGSMEPRVFRPGV